MTTILKHPHHRHHHNERKKHHNNHSSAGTIKKVIITPTKKKNRTKKRKHKYTSLGKLDTNSSNIIINKIKHHAKQTQKLNIILNKTANKNTGHLHTKTLKRKKTPEEIERKKKEILRELDKNKETSLGAARGILKGGKNYVPRLNVKKTRKKILESRLREFCNETENDESKTEENINMTPNLSNIQLRPPLKSKMNIDTRKTKIHAATVKNIILPAKTRKQKIETVSQNNNSQQHKIINELPSMTKHKKRSRTRKVHKNEFKDKKLIKILNSDGLGLNEFNIRKEI
jgi:hypothetical protein